MRKRKGKFVKYTEPKKEIKKHKTSFKTLQTSLMLIGICFLVLFLNSYFNFNSGTVFNPDGDTLGTRFYLSGPDPYLNMRTCEETLIQGRYPYVQPHESDYDPLLNYPVGERGSRPPLFNMMAVGLALVLENFMPQMDALGWSMLFLPAIYGAFVAALRVVANTNAYEAAVSQGEATGFDDIPGEDAMEEAEGLESTIASAIRYTFLPKSKVE